MGHGPRLRTLVVVNPAAGDDEPVVATLNDVLGDLEVEWDAVLTHGPGDARAGAERALAEGCDLVAVYGGDGTVSETAMALAGKQTPLAILPGGTGNVVAQELGIAPDLEGALRELFASDRRVEAIDVLEVAGRLSLLRVGIGADAAVMRRTSREDKDRLGWMAYFMAALEEAREREASPLRLELDGRRLEVEAVAALAANVGRLGRGGIEFPGHVDPFDGQLDLFIVTRADAAAVLELGVRMLGPEGELPQLDDSDEGAVLLHASGRHLRVETPGWPIHYDGEVLGETPVEIVLRPGAVRVVLPAASSDTR